jgi:hypothetical protein
MNMSRARGIVNIWVALCFPLFIAFAGLAVDTGFCVVSTMKLQDAADAAALAGASQVLFNTDTAISAARDATVNTGKANYVGGLALQLNRNDGNSLTGEVVVGHYDRATSAFTNAPGDLAYGRRNAVMVNATRADGSSNPKLPAFFGPIFGVSGYSATRTAIAMTGNLEGDGVIVLNPHDPGALHMNGNPTLTISGGNLQVNSDASDAVSTNGKPTIDVDLAEITGGISSVGPFTGEVLTGQSRVEDPLAALPAPAIGTDLGKIRVTGNKTVNLQPGYYSGGITITSGSAVLAPGVYVLGGAGLDLGGNANLDAQGVMFYIVGSGAVNLKGNGAVNIRAMDPNIDHTVPADIAETYQGVAFFQARTNTNASSISGTKDTVIDGTVYFPATSLDLGGNASWKCTQVIADTVSVSGNGDIMVDYDGRFPALSHAIFLVK